MLNTSKALKLSGLIFVASAMSAAPAFAQIGGITGSVGGTLDTNVRANVNTPDVRVRVPAETRVRSSSPSYYSGTHYHGAYAHDHGRYGYNHFHDDRYSHTHGYASLTVEIRADQDRADVGPLLTYGVKVESRKGEDLGRIVSMSRTETGMVISVTVDGVPRPIPVDTLKVEDDLLVTSLKKKELKG